ncbi:hypothetical protein [Arsenicicoccus piscis]|uniref:hypothetical protein n=1 Tax=Arsenicicoccus piscis TaxID=673954 RepID=UPI0024E0B7C7|nr:hypothetical protein [Arsenicicoccus piscis]
MASFVVTENRKTVFVGMYQVDGLGTCPPGSTDLLLNEDVSGHYKYELRLLDALANYQDKVVIDWGRGTRTWVQLAANQPKPVIEITQQYEPPFPGFRTFLRPIDEIPTLPNSWQQVLRSVKGIYLLVDRDSGSNSWAQPRALAASSGAGPTTRTAVTAGMSLSRLQLEADIGTTMSRSWKWSTKTRPMKPSRRASPTGRTSSYHFSSA